MAFKLISANELKDFPPPLWLIDGFIEEGVLAVLYGAPGEGKSFVALDWALSIATGTAWQGRTVMHGPTVYVVAEGSRNIGKRIAAWRSEHTEVNVKDMFVIMEPVQVSEADAVSEFINAIDHRNLNPSLVIIDTLARCFLGGDENSSQDMGKFVEGCNEIQRAFGATVLVVHHTGKPTGRKPKTERGSSALRAASDVMVRVSQSLGTIHVAVEKQKDEETGDDICVRLTRVVLGRDASGVEVASCVLTPALRSATRTTAPREDQLNGSELNALQVLINLEEMKSGAWHAAIQRLNSEEISAKTFQNWRRRLVDDGFAEEVHSGSHIYRPTDKGLEYCATRANGVPSAILESPLRASHATPPKGVAGGKGIDLRIPGQRVTTRETVNSAIQRGKGERNTIPRSEAPTKGGADVESI